MLEFIEKLEGAVQPPEIPPTPLLQVANTMRSVASAVDRLNSTLRRLQTSYPEQDILPDVMELIDTLERQDFETAEQMLARIQLKAGYCDEQEQIQRSLELLAWLVYLLVKDNLPDYIRLDLTDYIGLLENADWLLRNFGTLLIDRFFELLKEVIQKRFGRIDAMIDFLLQLLKTEVTPCSIHALLNDAGALILTAKLTDSRIKDELRARTKQDVTELGGIAKEIAVNGGVGPWDMALERTRTLGQLAHLTKNWLNATGMARLFSSLAVFPKTRSEVFKMRGASYEKPQVLSTAFTR